MFIYFNTLFSYSHGKEKEYENDIKKAKSVVPKTSYFSSLL